MPRKITPDRHRDCAAIGGDTISRRQALIDDEQIECVHCGHRCRWDLTESRFWGFESNCGEKEKSNTAILKEEA